jgi:TonB family protein
MINEPDPIDLLMEDVLREVANPAPPAKMVARVQTQLRAANIPVARPTAPPSNLLLFTPLDRTGGRGMSRQSVTMAVLLNLAAMFVLIIASAAVKKTVDDRRKMEIAFVQPLKEKPPEPPKPKLPPPPKLAPPLKPIETPEPPKIKLPDAKIPEPPKPMPVAVPKPVPVVVPAPPKIQKAAAAPNVVSVTMAAKSASVVNNDPHPSAVSLGHPDSPVPFQKSGPAVAAVNMNRGMSGMPPSNSGSGPPATKVTLGNGSPSGSIGGTAPAAVAGVKLGCVGCTGTGPGNGNKIQAAQVSLGAPPPPPPAATAIAKTSVRTAPQVLYKPQPVYTAEAKNLHIEGTVNVRIHVSATGVVTVLGISSGALGHGLNESAIACAKGIRFKPALDADGNPVDWDGLVSITFQIA